MEKLQERNLGLDVLRSLAILLVLVRHGQFLLEGHQKIKVVSFLVDALDGVVLFFVLSGFLIGSNILKMNMFSWEHVKNFLVRRWLRTLPAYYCMLLLLIALTSEPIASNWTFFVFLQNVFTENLLFFQESWSLSVEEWYYFLFPLLVVICVLFIPKKGSYFLVTSLLLLIPFFFIFNYSGAAHLINKAVVYRLSNIAWGMMGAGILYYFPKFWTNTKRYATMLSFLLLAYYLINPHQIFQAESLTSSTFLSVVVLFSLPFWLSLNGKGFSKMKIVFQKISEWSYALYLVNLSLVQGIVLKHFEVTTTQDYCLFWIFSLLFALVLHYAIEKPILRWRNDHFRIDVE